MVSNVSKHSLQSSFPVKMYWTFDDGDSNIDSLIDGEIPELNVTGEEIRGLVFGAYGVDSLGELEEQVTSSARNTSELRLGVITGKDADMQFHPEVTLLASVEGVNENLASGLINEYDDIPSLCKAQRSSGWEFLGELRQDAEVEGQDWVDDLKTFIESLGPEDNLELRLKNAGVWVEPGDVSAGI